MSVGTNVVNGQKEADMSLNKLLEAIQEIPTLNAVGTGSGDGDLSGRKQRQY